LNKNIRYCQNNSPYNIYQEDENGDELNDNDYKSESGRKKKSASKIHKYNRNMKKQIKGTARGLDIILDEEEDADQEQENEIARENKRREIDNRYSTLGIEKDGSICFFNKNPDSDNEILEKHSVNSSIEFKDRTK
jgi:hypothetical protein